MEYKILINKEAKPVLVEAHEPADTQNHISFKHPHLETKDILWELFRTKTKFAHLQELVGQTFDLPANVKVSFEYRYMGQSCFDGETYKATPISLVGKLAILSTEPAASQHVPSDGVIQTPFCVTKASEVQQGGEQERKGMEVLKIYRFQAEQIEDTFRLVQRIFECHKKESSVDRDVMQSWQMIKNVLSGKIDDHVSRM